MPNRRKPNTLFLPARIKRLMQKDEEVGKLSATVPVIAARALEQFLEELITKSASITISLQAKTLTPEHIRQFIYADARLSFLHDLANRMGTGPNNVGRTLSTSSAISTTTNRSPFQQQLSVPYQDPLPLPSTTSTNQSNLLYINHQISRTYTNQYYTKVKTNKRSFDVVDDEQEEDDDDDNDNDDDDDERFMSNHTAT
ncbi:unnamed protein product [Rotaria sp. Silwood1]|nr:unnamed protein product [Rotaria sp. Silwood1]CAF1168867.1 unnamed protein product [Rotaria sp. Silwood1]CAF1173205.1 unnamed protein product [Rotaria sp. Silwood1]CAF3468985.1 unnamed protein product [Rotaria sp. Silwood1]CAF3472737.1 unnamed protein product [Rotaria sp. Silwood1]